MRREASSYHDLGYGSFYDGAWKVENYGGLFGSSVIIKLDRRVSMVLKGN